MDVSGGGVLEGLVGWGGWVGVGYWVELSYCAPGYRGGQAGPQLHHHQPEAEQQLGRGTREAGKRGRVKEGRERREGRGREGKERG